MHTHCAVRRYGIGTAIAGLALLSWLSVIHTLSYFESSGSSNTVEYSGMLEELLAKLHTAEPSDVPLLIAALDIDDLLIRQTAFTALQQFHDERVLCRLITLFERESNQDFLIRIARELTVSYPRQSTIDVFSRQLSCTQELNVSHFLSAFHLFLLTDDNTYLEKIAQCMASDSYTLRYLYLLWSKEICHSDLISMLERYYLTDWQFAERTQDTIAFIRRNHRVMWEQKR